MLSVRVSTNVALEVEVACVPGPSSGIKASEYAIDPGRFFREGG